jgi:hypothetical protein
VAEGRGDVTRIELVALVRARSCLRPHRFRITATTLAADEDFMKLAAMAHDILKHLNSIRQERQRRCRDQRT